MEILEKVQQYMVQKILLNEGVSIFRKHVHLFSQLKFSFVMSTKNVYEKSSVFGAHWSNPFGGSNATNPTHRAQKWTLQHHPFFGQKPYTSQSCDGCYFKPTFAAASFKAGKCEGAQKPNGFCTNFFVGNNNNWAVGKQNLVIFHEILIGMCVSNIWI